MAKSTYNVDYHVRLYDAADWEQRGWTISRTFTTPSKAEASTVIERLIRMEKDTRYRREDLEWLADQIGPSNIRYLSWITLDGAKKVTESPFDLTRN